MKAPRQPRRIAPEITVTFRYEFDPARRAFFAQWLMQQLRQDELKHDQQYPAQALTPEVA